MNEIWKQTLSCALKFKVKDKFLFVKANCRDLCFASKHLYLPAVWSGSQTFKSVKESKNIHVFKVMKTMKIQALFVLVLILKSCVCFELTETFGRQTIEDGPYGGEFNIVFNVFQFNSFEH